MDNKILLAVGIVVVILLTIGISIFASQADNPILNALGLQKKPPLEKVVFIHYKKGFEKATCGNGLCEPGEKKTCPQDCGGETEEALVAKGTKCYTFLSKWAKWKTPEPYLVNPTNADGLGELFVKSAVDAGVTEWETREGSRNIFGDGVVDYYAYYNSASPDNKNAISFGDYPDSSVIAVAVVWGYFSGPPSTREIVEYDILFNDKDYAWGDAAANSALMDLQNIATHELGHGAGMGDLYTTACAEETMYGYSTNGETKKRDLNTGDITGIKTLYGS